MNYSENKSDRKGIEDGEVEELPSSSVDFEAVVIESYAKSMDKSMDEVNELEQLSLRCSDVTHNPAIDLPMDSNESVNMPKKEIGKNSLMHNSITGTDVSDQISN